MLNIVATIIAIVVVCLLLGAMLLFIRLTTDDSDRNSQLKEMVEALFGTPAHLKREAEISKEQLAASASSFTSTEPFAEPCPACSHTVTEKDAECPSCGLRLL